MKNKLSNATITACIAGAILLIVVYLREFYPFGDRQILIIDSWHQYYPILAEMHARIRSGQSLFYAFTTGAGTNFWLMIANYAMSPLNLLSLLFPTEYLREFMWGVTLLKISIAGACFTYYLQSNYKADRIPSIIFGLLYAFSGFFMGYYWNIMWLDAAALLPLIVLGLHRVLGEGDSRLYSVSLGLAMISSFYASFFICLFIVIYAPFYYLVKTNRVTVQCFINKMLRVALSSLLAAALAMVVLLPVYYGLSTVYGHASNDPESFKAYYHVIDVLARLLPLSETSVIDGPPNLAVASLAILFTVVYFYSKNVRLREKVFYGTLLIFICLSFTINYLDFAWHGFHFPNQVPHRFAFIFGFLIINVAHLAYRQLPALALSQLIKAAALITLFMLSIEQLRTDAQFTKNMYITLAFLTSYLLLLALYKQRVYSRQHVALILLVVVSFELLLIANQAFDNAGSSSRATYPDKAQAIAQTLELIEGESGTFGRVEVYPRYSSNDPLLYHYHGISQFSSMANAAFNDYTRSLGLSAAGGSNAYKYYPNTPIANGFLTLDYLIVKNNRQPIDTQLYEEVAEVDDVVAYKNNYSFPFGFVVDRAILNYHADGKLPFQEQNTLINLASGQTQSLFTDIAMAEPQFKDATFNEYVDYQFRYRNDSASDRAEGSVSFTAPRDGHIYLYARNSHRKLQVSREASSREFDPRNGVVVDMGFVKADSVITCSFGLPSARTGYFVLQPVYFDIEAFSRQYQALMAQPLHITNFTDTSIEGTVTAKQAGLLYLALPYERGWQLYVDGERRELLSFNHDVVLVELTGGKHEIALSYRPPGFAVGLVISILALIYLLVGKRLKNQHIRRRAASAGDSAAAEQTPVDGEELVTDAAALQADAIIKD